MQMHIPLQAGTSTTTAPAATTTTTTPGLTSLTDNQFTWLLLVVVVGVVVIGALVILGRWVLQGKVKKGVEDSLMRSWIAFSFVFGLLVFGAASFAVNDASIRNVILGGIVASTSTAMTFYFAATSSDKAQQRILTAAGGSIAVPDLTGMTVPDATAVMAKVALVLVVQPQTPNDGDVVTAQAPLADAQVANGSTVTVQVGPGR